MKKYRSIFGASRRSIPRLKVFRSACCAASSIVSCTSFQTQDGNQWPRPAWCAANDRTRFERYIFPEAGKRGTPHASISYSRNSLRRKFWPSNITKYCGVGSNRWASTSHYEQQRGRKKADRCRCLCGMKIRGAHAWSVLAMAFCHRELHLKSDQRLVLSIHVVGFHI